jgi:hypothetical protein
LVVFYKSKAEFCRACGGVNVFYSVNYINLFICICTYQLFLGSQKAYLILTGIYMLFETSYKAWGYYQLLGYNSKKNAFKTFSYSLLVSIFWAVISAGLGFLYVGGFFG